MSEKIQLNEEQLNKVAGGTYKYKDGVVFYTMEEIRKLYNGFSAYGYEILGGYYLNPLGIVQYRGFNKKGYPEFHGSYTFTVGDNERYFVGPRPLSQEDADME